MKTISLEEAKKLATPGKLIPIHGEGTCFHEGNRDSIQWECGKDGEETMMETVAEIWPTSPPKRAKIDAALLAHRWNRFDEVVEALKALVHSPVVAGMGAAIRDRARKGGEDDPYAQALSVLQRAKEVEIP